jgi:hypothetical protein
MQRQTGDSRRWLRDASVGLAVNLASVMIVYVFVVLTGILPRWGMRPLATVAVLEVLAFVYGAQWFFRFGVLNEAQYRTHAGWRKNIARHVGLCVFAGIAWWAAILGSKDHWPEWTLVVVCLAVLGQAIVVATDFVEGKRFRRAWTLAVARLRAKDRTSEDAVVRVELERTRRTLDDAVDFLDDNGSILLEPRTPAVTEVSLDGVQPSTYTAFAD